MSSTLRENFFQHIAQTSEAPLALEIVNATGCKLIDRAGKEYIDLISGIAVSNLGHNHPEIIKAIKNQADSYLHVMVYGELIESPQVQLATELATLLPSSLSSSYFVNSGAEAIEGALKLAKKYTGRSEIVVFKNAYHGSTLGALSVCGNEDFKNNYRPLIPGVRILEYNNIEQLKEISRTTAAVLIEPIQGEAGVIVGEKKFLNAVRKKCDETKSLLIFDEIQTAMGRTGELFEFQSSIVPDILVLSKAFGGGMPLGAFISSKDIMSTFTTPPLGHITTFGGHPVCCAAALAALNIVREKSFLEAVKAKEKLFRQKLIHPAIKQVKGKGLLLALEFENEKINRAIINTCIENGVLVDWFLFSGNSMRIAPPLIISEQEIEQVCTTIIRAIENYEN